MKKNLIILSIFLIISCVISYVFRHYADFDFYAYHYFNGWAFLHNRINIDILPCLFRSYFNPILDSLVYLSIIMFNNHPLLFILFSGLKYGIFAFLTYKIAELIFKQNGKLGIQSTIFCVILTCFSPILIYCINFDNTDIQVGVLILIGIYIYLKNVFESGKNNRMRFIIVAGLFFGLAIGLKYSCLASPIAILIVTICLYKRIENTKQVIISLIQGMIYGFLVTGFPWMALMYYKFQNPLFPYFNNIFLSPKADFDNMLTADFAHLMPKTFIDFIIYPIQNTLTHDNISLEKRYFDLKNIAGVIYCIIGFLLTRIDNIENKYKRIVNFNFLYFTLLFLPITFYLNLLVFANIRYILPVLVFVPVLICLITKIICNKQFYLYNLIIIGCLFFLTTSHVTYNVNWPFLIPDKVVNISKVKIANNSTVICANFMACFFAPEQNNQNVRYVGFSLQPELLEKSYLAHSGYKNFNYKSKYLRNVISNILHNDKNIYFAYLDDPYMIGYKKEEVLLYEKSLSLYTNKRIKLNKCQLATYTVLDDGYSTKIKVCKLNN